MKKSWWQIGGVIGMFVTSICYTMYGVQMAKEYYKKHDAWPEAVTDQKPET